MLALATVAAAEPDPNARANAARAYDEGVARFERADYAAAARAFLEADDLAPSADAVTNALAAARKSNDHLLVVRAAERGTAREGSDPVLASASREALSQAARSLSRIDLRCEPAPCRLLLDGEAVEPGARFVLPGTHRAAATGEGGAEAAEALSLVAGATYMVTLHPVRRGEELRAAEVRATPGPGSASPGTSRAPHRGHPDVAPSKPLPPAVFYVGVGATLVMGGLTTWSGLDTLSARRSLSDTPTAREVDAVEDKILRSNLLFAGATVFGVATVLGGLVWVDFGGEASAEVAVLPVPGGATAAARGRF